MTAREEEAGQGRAHRGRVVEDEQLDLEEEDDEGPTGGKGRAIHQEQPHVEEDEEVDIMNSPLQQPWGHEVGLNTSSAQLQHLVKLFMHILGTSSKVFCEQCTATSAFKAPACQCPPVFCFRC